MKLLVERSSALPLVSVGLTFRGGCVHDPAGKSGLARIAARMLRRGCRGLTADQIEQRVDALGADLSAYVGLGSSSVACEFLKRSQVPVVDLVARLVYEPVIDEQELAKLRRQSEAEIIRSRDNDALLCSRALRRQLFADHPHGRRVAGRIDEIAAIERSDVGNFYARHYTRANAFVTVSGDVDERDARTIAERVTRHLPDGRPEPYPADEPQLQPGRRLVIIDKPDRSQTQMAIGTLGTHACDDDHTALLVANQAFGGIFTSRLMQEVRAKRGWSYGASSHLSTSFVREAFSMWTAPSAVDAAACLELELDLLNRWRQDGITAAELDFCKGYLRRSYAFEIDTPKKRLLQKLERALLNLPDDYHAGFVQRVEALTLDDANRAIKNRINDANLVIAAVATEAEIGDQLRRAIDDLAECVVLPHDVE